VLGHDLAQEGDSVHARHFHIEDDDVRPADLHPLQGKYRINRGADDLDGVILSECGRQDLADHRRVVDDHDLDGRHGIPVLLDC
jgi:hypothetical protein